jgi:hypothetical protein
MKYPFEPGQLLLYVNEENGTVKFGILLGEDPQLEFHWRSIWFPRGEGTITYTHPTWNIETWIRMRKKHFNEQ